MLLTLEEALHLLTEQPLATAEQVATLNRLGWTVSEHITLVEAAQLLIDIGRREGWEAVRAAMRDTPTTAEGG